MRISVGTTTALAVALMLTGCAGTPEQAPNPAASSTTQTDSSKESAAESETTTENQQVVETRMVATDGSELEVRVYPLSQVGEYVVLTADLIPTQIRDDSEWISGRIFGLDPAAGVNAPVGLLRLVDATGLRMHLPALDAANKIVGTGGGSFVIKPEGLRVQQVYAAPDSNTSLGLLLPGHYIDELPVVELAPPAPTITEDSQATPIDTTAVAVAPVVALDSISRQLDGAVQVIESSEEVQIDLSGDVLFETASAELSPEANAMIDAAAKTINARGSGQVAVVGHTDNVGDDASNQTLSEQRASAVARALKQLIDSADFDITTSGRGETEPIAPNDNDANRQLNRRVTLTLVTEEVTRSEITATGELPPFDKGPVATGAEGFDDALDADTTGAFHVSAPEARRVGELLVVTVEAERTDVGTYNDAWAYNLAASPNSYRGTETAMEQWPFSPRLLVGDTAVYPLDYTIGTRDSGTVEYRLAGDNDAQQSAGPGQTLRFVALFPDVPDAKEIAIENSGAAWVKNYRLTNISVE